MNRLREFSEQISNEAKWRLAAAYGMSWSKRGESADFINTANRNFNTLSHITIILMVLSHRNRAMALETMLIIYHKNPQARELCQNTDRQRLYRAIVG